MLACLIIAAYFLNIDSMKEMDKILINQKRSNFQKKGL